MFVTDEIVVEECTNYLKLKKRKFLSHAYKNKDKCCFKKLLSLKYKDGQKLTTDAY